MIEFFANLPWFTQAAIVLCCYGVIVSVIRLAKYLAYVIGSAHENRCRVKVAKHGGRADW